MTIGTVQASPLTMANVYATMGANGVECAPIAITKVTDRSGSKVKVPSANCHQAIDPDIAQTVSYAHEPRCRAAWRRSVDHAA